jgi:hypothetical protein
LMRKSAMQICRVNRILHIIPRVLEALLCRPVLGVNSPLLP